MANFPLPSPGIVGQSYQFATIPSNFATPSKLFFKNTTAAYVFDGSSVVQVTSPNYPALTVPGVAYLNGRIYVMAPDGTISGSETFDPLTWLSTTIIAAKSEGDPAVALVRHLVYIVALKATSSEFFIDAGLPSPGSPLTPMLNAFQEVGCAVAGSIGFTDNTVFFMSESLPKGRSISRLDGLDSKIISNVFIDRILNSSDLSEVFAFVVKKNGHVFYVITITDIALTLVFDDVQKDWHRWTNYTVGTVVNVTLVVLPSGLIEATTVGPCNQRDGDPISITYTSMAGPFTETVNITWIPSLPNKFTFTALTDVVAGAASYLPWVESYFPGIFYTRGTNEDFLISETGSKVFEFDENLFQDVLQPINLKARTAIDDWGVMRKKYFRRLELVGDLDPTTVRVRTNDTDYGATNWSQYRPILVQDDRAQIKALGAGRRRAHEFRHTDNTALRMIALEADFDVGAR